MHASIDGPCFRVCFGEKVEQPESVSPLRNQAEYLAASLLDMDYHTLTEPTELDINVFEKASMDADSIAVIAGLNRKGRKPAIAKMPQSHRMIESSHHRTDQPQIAQIDRCRPSHPGIVWLPSLHNAATRREAPIESVRRRAESVIMVS